MTNERRLIHILKKLKHEETEYAPPDKMGISPSQVNIIDQVFFAQEITMKDLSNSLNLTPPTISVSVKKLENMGILERKAQKEDGRIVLLLLTEKGIDLFNRIEEFRIARVTKLLNQLEEEQQIIMLSLLEKALKIHYPSS
jgi:DNA-binding MarR family transcriptional regulator